MSGKIWAVGQFLLLVALYSFVTFAGRNSDPYFNLFTLDQNFATKEYIFGSSFSSATSLDAVWNSVEDIFIPNLFPTTSSDGKPLSEWEELFLADGTNMRLGAVRLRIVRVKSLYCLAPKGTLASGDKCYPQYYTCMFDRGCLHATGRYTPKKSNTSYAYQDTGEGSYLAPDTRINYSGSGYVVDMRGTPALVNGTRLGDRVAAETALLRSQEWIDVATRALFIEFNTLNPNTGTVSNARFCAEFLGTGGVRTSFRIVSAPLLRYVRVLEGDPISSWARVIVFAEALFFAYAFVFIGLELRRTGYTCFKESRRQTAVDVMEPGAPAGASQPEHARQGPPQSGHGFGWSVVMWTNLSLIVIMFILKLAQIVGTLQLDLQSHNDFNEDIQSLLDWSLFADCLNAFTAFLLFLNVFRDISHLPIISQYIETLAEAAKAMSSFAVVLLLGLVFFGIAFLLAFGAGVGDYRDLLVSVTSLFRTTLGDFDLDSISRQNYILGPFLFVFFIVVMFFVVLSMVLSVVSDAFQRIREQHQEALATGHHLDDELFTDLVYLYNCTIGRLMASSYNVTRKGAHSVQEHDTEGLQHAGEPKSEGGADAGDEKLSSVSLHLACKSTEAHIAYAATYQSALNELGEAEAHQATLNAVLAKISSQLDKAERALEEENEKAGAFT